MRKTPVTLGVLSIVLGTLFSSLMMLVLVALWRIGESNRAYHLADALVTTVTSIALVVVGIGLLLRRRWSRAAALAWAAASLANTVGNLGIESWWLREAHTTADLVAAAVDATFPLVLIVLLGRRSALRDFLPATASATPAAPALRP